MSKIICIDPGHGGVDVGAVRGSRYEKSDNLRMAKAVKALLEPQGIKVVLTRDGDTNPSLSSRCDIANNAKADYFLSIHRNSFGNQTAAGAEIWVHHAAQQSTVNKAQRILDEILSVGDLGQLFYTFFEDSCTVEYAEASGAQEQRTHYGGTVYEPIIKG